VCAIWQKIKANTSYRLIDFKESLDGMVEPMELPRDANPSRLKSVSQD